MTELLDAIAGPAGTLGLGALVVAILGLVLRALYTGALVFRVEVDKLRADKDAELARNTEFCDKLVALAEARASSWETAYRNLDTALSDQGATLDKQLEYSRAADHMLRALPSSKAALPIIEKSARE